MKKILVTGASGQLGNEFRDIEINFPHHQFLFVSKNELDISSTEAIATLFSSFKPEYCINCAAYTAVDKAETELDLAIAINTVAAGNLALACKVNNAKFIHISTDYVFDGKGTKPYLENDLTNPVNAYGKTKLDGELEAIKENADSVIIRTSWVYSAYGNNFVKTMIRLMQSRPEIGVVADQQGSPTYAADLAEAILQMVEHQSWHPGIYHYSNEGIITWYDFAQAIKEQIQSDCKINSLTTEQYPTPAKRPAYSGLSKEKIKSVYNLKIKPWENSLDKCLEKLKIINN